MTDFHVTLGKNINGGRDITLPALDHQQHLYIVGKTGVGKTKLIENICLDAVHAGYGVCYIDPHGDSAKQLLDHIPERRTRDVVWFSPADTEYPIQWNVLANVPPTDYERVAGSVVSAIMNIWKMTPENAPVINDLIYNSVYVLMEHGHASKDENPSLADIPKLLKHEQYRARVLRNCTNSEIKSFWEDEYDQYNDRFRQERTASTMLRIRRLLVHKTMRLILGASTNQLNMRELMDEGKIIIANLSKGRLGEEPVSLLGGLLVEEIKNGALSREDIAEQDRRWFGLITDEFQNFGSAVWPEIVNEARKYGLSLTASHQYTKQIDETTKDAMLNTPGNLIAFRVGAHDADTLRDELDCAEAKHLMELGKHRARVRLTINRDTTNVETIETVPIEERYDYIGNTDSIIRASRDQYCVTINKAISYRQSCDEADTTAPHRYVVRKRKEARTGRKPKHTGKV